MRIQNLRRHVRRHRAWFGWFFVARRAAQRLRSAIDRDHVKVTTYMGREFVYPADSMIGKHIADRGDWDAILVRIVRAAFPQEAPFICEVGSNIGASLLQILRGKPQAQVLALEPSDAFRPFLVRNLQASGAPGVQVLPLFVGAQPGTTWLYNNESTASVSAVEYANHKPRGRQKVEVTTLDQLLSSHEDVDFVKVDTDGFDFEVLKGARHILRTRRPLLFFELVPSLMPDCAANLRELQAEGYRRFVCLSPGQMATVIGVTDDPEQAITWASKAGYCDILCWQSQTTEGEARFAGLEREVLELSG